MMCFDIPTILRKENMSEQYRRAPAAVRDSWNLAQYVVSQNRASLMVKFNEIVGLPCYSMAVVQYEFVSGTMDFVEMMEYAETCLEIIYSIELTSDKKKDPR